MEAEKADLSLKQACKASAATEGSVAAFHIAATGSLLHPSHHRAQTFLILESSIPEMCHPLKPHTQGHRLHLVLSEGGCWGGVRGLQVPTPGPSMEDGNPVSLPLHSECVQ